MHIIVTIDGKDAIPVRAIPLLTDWEVLSPDVCANAFAGEETTEPNLEGHPTFRLNSDGSHEAIDQRWWANWIVRELDACSKRIATETKISHEVGYQQWRQESLALLPSGVFVWREAFEAAYLQEYGPGSMRVRFSDEPYQAGTYDLNFNPEHGPRNDWRELVMEGFEQFAAAAPSAAPVVAESASGETAGPLPLTTGDIAFCFAGLRWNTEDEWKVVLGKGRSWIEACVAVPAGGRGRGVAPKLWNPVLLAAALVNNGDIKRNSARARFQNAQNQRLLGPWLETWKTYEADNFDTN